MASLLSILALFVTGAAAGALANHAIHSWGYFRRRPVSPWAPPAPAAPARQWFDRLPIVGWITLQREIPVHGRWFWLRPLLIEFSLALFAVWFWYWQHQGGLSGMRVVPSPEQARLWFGTQGLLFTLLVAATFIDFDEQTIPDLITIPGTVAGLLFAIVAPSFHLPELEAGTTGLLATHPVTFSSPSAEPPPGWAAGWAGLLLGTGIVAAWCAGLAPKHCTLRWGWRRGLWLMWASATRCPRRTPCAIRVSQRGPFALTWIVLVLGAVLTAVIAGVWAAGGERWTSLLTSLLGMGFGGGVVWAVRIIAGQALGQEAMGFGDVTLMAMIGTFTGWQAALLVFSFAPLAALLIVVFQFLLTRNRELAFGPWLALAAVAVILGWGRVWNEWARLGVFQMPGLLLGAIGASLVLMWFMLAGLQWMRGGTSHDGVA